MLHMQHAQLAALLMEKAQPPKIEFPIADREHRRQLEAVRDSLLLRPEIRRPSAHGA